MLAQLAYQSGHAVVWRDAINDWFHRISGIADAKGRVGNHPDRIEAESMLLEEFIPRWMLIRGRMHRAEKRFNARTQNELVPP